MCPKALWSEWDGNGRRALTAAQVTPHILHIGFERIGHKKRLGITQLKVRPVDDVLTGTMVAITVSGLRLLP